MRHQPATESEPSPPSRPPTGPPKPPRPLHQLARHAVQRQRTSNVRDRRRVTEAQLPGHPQQGPPTRGLQRTPEIPGQQRHLDVVRLFDTPTERSGRLPSSRNARVRSSAPASSTRTDQPRRDSAQAADKPSSPPPTTTQRRSEPTAAIIGSAAQRPHRGRRPGRRRVRALPFGAVMHVTDAATEPPRRTEHEHTPDPAGTADPRCPAPDAPGPRRRRTPGRPAAPAAASPAPSRPSASTPAPSSSSPSLPSSCGGTSGPRTRAPP